MDATRLLDAAPRCLLACAGPAGPLLAPVAHWYDGRELWLTAPADAAVARALAADPACTVCLPQADMVLLADGDARRFGLEEPLGLAVHAAPVGGALAALAARHTGALLDRFRAVALTPAEWVRNRVVVRVRLGQPAIVSRPEPGPGLAPALPPALPADVRRALAGRRQVLVAHGAGRPRVTAATWDADLRLAVGRGWALEAAGPAAVAAEDGDERGVVLEGTLAAGRLEPGAATWWRGARTGSVEVAAAARRGVVLPD